MEDFDFDKLFAEKMRKAGAPDFSEEDWERLHPVLDAEHRRRWRVIPLWWLGALSGLLLCSNIGWWWLWQQSEKRTKALETAWAEMSRERVMHRDTTYEKVVVYKHDTIYRTIVYRTVAENISAGENILVEKTSPRSQPAATTAVSTVLPETTIAKTSSPATAAGTGIAEKDTPPLHPGAGSAPDIVFLPSKITLLSIPARPVKFPDKDFVTTPQKRASRPIVSIPKKIRAGAGVGLLIPASPYLTNSFGFTACLTGELAFSEKLALTLEGSYSGINFKGTVYDEGLGLPPENSPGDDYELKYFELEEGAKTILQLTTGMRYWLRSTRKISPYLGLGYGMQWHQEYELKAEYYNPVTDKEKEVSTEVSPGKPVSMLDINAGLRYRFLRKWYWQTGAVYQFKLDKNQPGIPRYWGLKSTVLYTF